MIPLEELLEFMEPVKSESFVKLIRELGYPTIADDFKRHAVAIERKKLSELIEKGDPEADQYLGMDSIVRIEKENGKEWYVVEQRHSKVARQAGIYWDEHGSGALSDVKVSASRFKGSDALHRHAHFWETLGRYYTKRAQATSPFQEGLSPYMQKSIASFYAAWDNFTRVPYQAESGRELIDRVKSSGIDLLKIKAIRKHYEQ